MIVVRVMRELPREFVWPLFVLSLLGGCKLQSRVTPETQVVVDIDAESLVRERMQTLAVQVVAASSGRDGQGASPLLSMSVQPGQEGQPSWPVRIVLKPRAGEVERSFAITATARDADADLVQKRIISGYMLGQVRYARLLLTDDCFTVSCGDRRSFTMALPMAARSASSLAAWASRNATFASHLRRFASRLSARLPLRSARTMARFSRSTSAAHLRS